ncbi:ABC transporter ATP-binding protein [Tsukamurella sp. 8F]|uniref:ABC transporter transmembrane domain-containing protein n=1 Tax=unclassified Tsukamurella TaxID=2633480 RepID=UPI0023B95FC9|nr:MULTISPECIES: ABC transporter ATP-binding protein [unclassified Tsukamurella]MDF0531162.1 ABC transporter ATP-binding protein [Tsukamurella sp. 8J]MDF0585891.1 ABC transporter ATP-binding protein [Tsukamurella sp. 8F]
MTDPAGLGRGRLNRWMPVLWQAPESPPEVEPFEITESMTPRRFLVKVLFAAQRYTLPGAVFATVAQVSMATMPVVVGVTIDRAITTSNRNQLLLWLGVLALVGIGRVYGARIAWQLMANAIQRVQHRLRATLSSASLHPINRSAKQPEGVLVSVMTNDVTGLAKNGLVVFPVAEVIAILYIAVALFVVSWPLGLATLIGAPVVVWIMGRLSGRFANTNREYQGQLATTVARAADLVTGYRVIKGVRAEPAAIDRYTSASRETLDGAIKTTNVLGRFLAGSGSISGLFVVAVAVFAGWMALHGDITVGELIAAVGLAQALLPQMNFITFNAVPALAGAYSSAQRVLAVLEESRVGRMASTTGVGAQSLPEVGIVIGEQSVLVTSGEIVGVESDDRTAGRIVAALVAPGVDGSVQVTVDGTPAEDLDLAHLRSRVVVSPHHAMIFSGTVAEGLALSGGPAERHSAALHAAACDDFIDIENADDEVGEMGNRLSGGQRQRVALARALASEAPVLVLHDPTTAVDSVTEFVIAERLRELRADRATLLITASPGLLAVCDRVVDFTDSELSV